MSACNVICVPTVLHGGRIGMKINDANLGIDSKYEIQKKRFEDIEQNTFADILFKGIEKDSSNEKSQLVGKYTDAKLGFDAYVYAMDQSDAVYDVRIDYHNGQSETRTLNMNEVNASNCDIIDLFAKMKYIEKEKGVDNPMSNHVLAHFYMENRTQNVDAKTEMNWIDMFQEQLDLENKNGNYKAAQKLEKILLYL